MNGSVAPLPPTRDRSGESSPMRLILKVELKRVVVNVITSVTVLVPVTWLVLELTVFVRIVIACAFQARCWDGSVAERESVLLPDNGKWVVLKLNKWLRLVADLDRVFI